MKEFEPILDEYSLEGYSMYSKVIAESQWGDRKIALSYLEKYWLPSAEYRQSVRPIQDRVFMNQEVGLPEMVFLPEFELMVARGGCLFVREEFDRIQECVVTLGDKSLFVVENTFGGRIKEPFFRMKFPSEIPWDTLTGGNFASAIMLEMPHKDFFVFSESARWGKYTASDYEIPLDIFGYRKELAGLFRQKLKVSEIEQLDVAQFVPPKYKASISQV